MKYGIRISQIILALMISISSIYVLANESSSSVSSSQNIHCESQKKVAESLLKDCAEVAQNLKTETELAQQVIKDLEELVEVKNDIIEEERFQKTGWRSTSIMSIILLITLI